MKVELEPFTLSFRAPFPVGRRNLKTREGIRVRVVDGERFGLGEACPLPEAGTETIDRTRQALATAPQWIRVPESLEDVERLLDRPELKGAPAARCALELALVDYLARKAGLKVASFLVDGAELSELSVGTLLDAREPRALAEQAAQAIDRGFQVVKVKVGSPDLADDALRLRAIRRRVGDDVAIRIDANGAWTEAEARTALRGLSPIRVELCEQPVAGANADALRRVRQLVPCPVAADEAVVQAGAEPLLEDERGPAADVVVLKPMVLGGILPGLALARRAHARGVDAYVTTTLDGVIARAAAAHLAASIPQRQLAHGLATGALFEGEWGGDRYVPSSGKIALPPEPGWGELWAR